MPVEANAYGMREWLPQRRKGREGMGRGKYRFMNSAKVFFALFALFALLASLRETIFKPPGHTVKGRN